MITGIKARNKNNLVWGISQLLGAGVRHKPLIVKICSLQGALVLLLAAMDLCYVETRPQCLSQYGVGLIEMLKFTTGHFKFTCKTCACLPFGVTGVDCPK